MKCNCVKHCECSLPAASATGSAPSVNNLLQLGQGSEEAKSQVEAPSANQDQLESEKENVPAEAEEENDVVQEVKTPAVEPKKVVLPPRPPSGRSRENTPKKSKNAADKYDSEYSESYSGEYSYSE